MSELVAYVTVFVAAAIPWLEVLLVVPAGIIAGLPAIPTVVVGAAGNASTLVPLVLAGDRLRSWWRDRRANRSQPADADSDRPEAPRHAHDPEDPDDAEEPAGRGGRARQLYQRFGLPGLALLGPLLTGVHVAGLAALAAGSPRKPTLLWLLGGLVLWAGLAALATVHGIDAFIDPDDLPDLFGLGS